MSNSEDPPHRPVSDDGLLDSDNELESATKATTGGGDLELDYDELMDNELPDDSLVVHANTEDIEEGEVTSDEEGEIKESEDDVSRNKSHQSPRQTASDDEEGVCKDKSKETDKNRKEKRSREKSKPVKERRGSIERGSSSDDRNSSDDRGTKRDKKDNQDKAPTLCRHFIGGKCNWGDNCRFLHENPERGRSHHDRMGGPEFIGGGPDGPWGHRGFPPLPHFMHGPGLMGHPHDIPPHMDSRMPYPPPGRGYMPPIHPYPLPPRDMRPPPFEHVSRGIEERKKPSFGGDSSRTEVREETDGWLRLRTVTQDWSSDEEQAKLHEEDLRHKIKSRGDSDSERPTRAADEWNDPWARDTKKTSKKKKKSHSSDVSVGSDSDEDKKKKKKKKVKKSKKTSSEECSDIEDERKRKTKKRKKKTKESSDEDIKKRKRYHNLGSPPLPPPFDPRRFDPREEFFSPHHFPPPMASDHRHPWPHPQYDMPPRPHPKKDQFGRDISKRMEYEDSKSHYPEDYRPRNGPLRRQSSDFSGSPTPPARPETSSDEERMMRVKKHKKSKNGDGDKRVSRKEKLLQELEAINKVIERKKSKKRSH